jgi:hypothetical protein
VQIERKTENKKNREWARMTDELNDLTELGSTLNPQTTVS